MSKKISIVKTEKTEEYLTTEWTTVLSVRDKLIQDSDWTQLFDSGLTLCCKLKFEHWRSKLKRIKKQKFKTPDEAKIHIDFLKLKKPDLDYAEFPETVSLYPLIFSSIQALKKSAKVRLNDYFVRTYYNSEIISLLTEEALEYSTDRKNIDSYELLKIYYLDNSTPSTDIVKSFVEHKKSFYNTLVKEKKILKIVMREIEFAKTEEKVILILEKYYGHRYRHFSEIHSDDIVVQRNNKSVDN